MRLRHCLLATTLLAGTAGAAAAQDPEPRPERRPWIRIEPFSRRPLADFYRFRIDPDRMRIVERSLERAERARSQALLRARGRLELAERARDRARDRAIERADQMREREFDMRERASERLRSSLRYSRELRERAMDRVRERLDYLREEHRHMIRRRLRTV